MWCLLIKVAVIRFEASFVCLRSVLQSRGGTMEQYLVALPPTGLTGRFVLPFVTSQHTSTELGWILACWGWKMQAYQHFSILCSPDVQLHQLSFFFLCSSLVHSTTTASYSFCLMALGDELMPPYL